MSDIKYLTTRQLTDIIEYKGSRDYEKDCVPISGNPRKHPYDSNRLVLILESHDDRTVFHDFKLNDIAHIEELPSITRDGVSLRQVQLWVKKDSWIIRSEAYKCLPDN